MTAYGQFCPVSKATEIIGEKWTMLILRELLMGTCRFNEFQRSMSRISPTILAGLSSTLDSVLVAVASLASVDLLGGSSVGGLNADQDRRQVLITVQRLCGRFYRKRAIRCGFCNPTRRYPPNGDVSCSSLLHFNLSEISQKK